MPTICKTLEQALCVTLKQSQSLHTVSFIWRGNMKLHNVQMRTGTNAELTDYETTSSQVPNSNTVLK